MTQEKTRKPAVKSGDFTKRDEAMAANNQTQKEADEPTEAVDKIVALMKKVNSLHSRLDRLQDLLLRVTTHVGCRSIAIECNYVPYSAVLKNKYGEKVQ